ncbi:MAG: PSD1 domain-containing protein, partial [Planctomycetes bacterium]|nr:PSD1 domain-containing protein [Planctomycetota bacterium]
MTRLGVLACVAATVASGLAASITAQTLSYSRDVRPILSQHCFRCHGPDEAAREAELRLDRPGRAATAPIVERITSRDPHEIMPPPSAQKPLSPQQIEVLTTWIAEGATYEKHWAFVPPRRPELPDNEARHPIDRFVRARLAGSGLTRAPEADKWTLVRRVYLDLIGLPPTIEEVDRFVADASKGAYERLVDRLLASPRYGERWARRWLDLARYADTNGYEKDRDRSIWPYRDWVIRALNDDMPYDRFAIEQIAGDMLQGATQSQVIATGFFRNTMLNEEGGIDPLEFRFHAMTDRVATTGTALLGLTVACAQCHTHKFDPITHREYYGLMAFLNNADEPDYFVLNEREEKRYEARLAEADAELAQLASKWPASAPPLEQSFDAWLTERRELASRWTTLVASVATSNSPKLVVAANGVVDVHGDTTKHDVYRLVFAPLGHEVRALRLEALPDDRLPSRGPGMTFYEGRKGDFYLSEFELRTASGPVVIVAASETHAGDKFGHAVSAQLTLDGDLQTGWAVDGRIGKRHVAIYELETPLPAHTAMELTMHFGRHFASSLGRFRISATAELRGDAKTALGEDVDALLALPREELTEQQRARLREYFLLHAPLVKSHADRIRALRRPPDRVTTLVMRERPAQHPRATHRHHRGDYLDPKERVEPSVPAVLHGFPSDAARDRLGFARWLVAPENPLAARVVVNRHWAAFFGEGIVRTLDDFGAQGELPSHPQLLDWLAVEFVERGWSIKALHKLIVTSQTYRQASVIQPEHLRLDPQNRLLARAPRFRLDAEVLRDAALLAAGVLSDKMYGPPVRPPQPEGVTEVAW